MTSFRILAVALLTALLAAGCATRSPEADLFDLGPALPTANAAAALTLPALSMPEVLTPTWLDSQTMFYRMPNTNDQPRPYAYTRWSMAPGLLLDQRIRSRITQAGGVVVPAADGVANLPMLRVEVDDFTQNFSGLSNSEARVVLRASLYTGRKLNAQKTFTGQAPATTADARGGARALAVASDAAIDALILWLASLPPEK